MIMEKFFEKKQLRDFEEKLLENSGKNIARFLKESIFLGLIAALIISAAGLFLKTEFAIIAIASISTVFVFLLAAVFLQLYLFEKNKRKRELLVPDALLQAAMFPEKTDIVKIIEYLSRAEYGLLSKEFEKTHSEIVRGKSVENALENMKQGNKSMIIDRMCNLLIQGYESGADMQQLFQETADDLLETNSIIRERIAAMAIEKYTILFAGGIIVPLVLGLIVGMVQEFNFASLNLMDFGMSAEERKNILEAALLGNQIYIAEYALLASVFLAHQENNRKKAIVYAMILLPLSFLAYFLAKGI